MWAHKSRAVELKNERRQTTGKKIMWKMLHVHNWESRASTKYILLGNKIYLSRLYYCCANRELFLRLTKVTGLSHILLARKMCATETAQMIAFDVDSDRRSVENGKLLRGKARTARRNFRTSGEWDIISGHVAGRATTLQKRHVKSGADDGH